MVPVFDLDSDPNFYIEMIDGNVLGPRVVIDDKTKELIVIDSDDLAYNSHEKTIWNVVSVFDKDAVNNDLEWNSKLRREIELMK